MKRASLNPARKPAGVAAAVVLMTVMLPACTYDHWATTDRIAPEAGDAIAVNKSQQTIDPMPKSARRTALKHDSDRLNKAIERYKDPPVDVDTGGDESLSEEGGEPQE